MSAFCVFGISKSLCKKTADKKQETFEIRSDRRVELSITEWAARRDEMAEKLFVETERAVQISPKFDAPQFCADWIASARSEVRSCVIMCRGEKVDKHGGPVIKDGVPAMTWVEYDPAKAPAFGPIS